MRRTASCRFATAQFARAASRASLVAAIVALAPLAASRPGLADESTAMTATSADDTSAAAAARTTVSVACRGGGGMTAAQTGQQISLTFTHAAEAGLPANEGECSLRDRPFAPSEPTVMTFDGGPLTGAELIALTRRPDLFGVVATVKENTFDIVAIEAITEPALSDETSVAGVQTSTTDSAAMPAGPGTDMTSVPSADASGIAATGSRAVDTSVATAGGPINSGPGPSASAFTGAWHITGSVGEHFELNLTQDSDSSVTGTYYGDNPGSYPQGTISAGTMTAAGLLAKYDYQPQRGENDPGEILFTLRSPDSFTALWTNGDVVPGLGTAGGTWSGSRRRD